MTFTEVVLLILHVLMLLPTIASLTKFNDWWVRGFDFPRIQISFLIMLVIIITFLISPFDSLWQIVLTGLLTFSFIYQIIKILPYTPIAKKQVLTFKGEGHERVISILVSNVLKTNTNYKGLKELIKIKSPDVILALETDKKWEMELETIEKLYPYTVKIPQDNFYGMHLYSRLKLEDIKVKNLIKDDIPSIHGYIRLNKDKKIKFHALHPKPPSPTEDDTSVNRDAELLIVGKDIKKNNESVMVFGDLNDVAWSRTTRLFQKISGLLDPRIGRGFYNTFHAGYKVLRWPLDHVFHSNDFTLIELSRLKNIGSDHFPIYIKLNYEPRAEKFQEEPENASKEEKSRANEKIEEGKPKDRQV